MKKENIRMIELLFAAGYKTEADILKIGLAEILQLGKLTHQQLSTLHDLQRAIQGGKLLPFLAGAWPEHQKTEQK